MESQVQTDRSPRRIGQGEVISCPLAVLSPGLSGNLDHPETYRLQGRPRESKEMPAITGRLPGRRQCRPGGDSHLTQQRGPPPGLAGLRAACVGTVIGDIPNQERAAERHCFAHSGTEL